MKSLRGGAKLVLFATGAAPAYAAGAKMWAANLQAGEREAVPHFYFQGGLNYEKMDGFDKFVMKALAWVLGRAKAKNEDEAKMAKALQNSYDASSRDAIAPLVAACS
jgi:hypothetical protein